MSDEGSSGGIGRWLKLAVLLIFLLGAAVLAHQMGLGDQTLGRLRELVREDAGILGRVGFVATYALLVTLTVPGTIVTVAGATLFPILEAFVYTIFGALIGASISFAVGRLLGREAIESLLGNAEDGGIMQRISSAVQTMEDNGIVAVAYLRMAYVPFVVLNYAAPLTGIRFRDFLVGTFLGILPGTFVFVFMGNTLGDVLETGEWSSLWMWKTPVAIGLFVASLALPWLANRWFTARKDTSEDATLASDEGDGNKERAKNFR